MPLDLRGNPVGPNLLGVTPDETTLAERLAKEESALRAMRGDNAFTRGFQSASTGLAAGESALRGQEAEGAGNMEEAARQRAYSLRQLADASILAPETQSYTQVDDVDSALNYAGGAAGSAVPTLLPSLAVGLLTRGRGTGAFAKGTAYAGALVPSYQMERNEALTSQLTDPAAMERSYEDRQLAARAKGAVGGVLEAALPAGLAAGFGKAGSKALNTVAGSAVTEGLTEGAQQFVGQQAQSYLNPERETADDGTQIIDAMIQGGIGGTTISGPNAVAGTVANQLDANKTQIGENLSGYREKLKSIPNPVDRLRNAFNDPVRDDAEAAEFGDADPSLRGATPEETMSNMDKRKAELGSIYDRLKTSVQERLPKAWLDKIDPQNPESYAAAIRDYDYSKKINSFVDSGKDIVDKFKSGEKNNLMSADPDTSARIYSMVIKNADPEIRDTSEFRKNAQIIGNTLTAFAARQGDITADEIPTIVSMASQIRDIFPDTESLSKELSNFVALEGSDNSFMRRILDVKSATADVAEAQSKKRKDVFLVQALEPEARKVLMQRPRSINALASLVDQAAGTGKMSKDMLAGLSDAFGGEQQAKAVVGYYRKQIRDSLKFEDSTQLEDADGVVIEADGLSDKEIQSGVTEREAAPANVAYKFADVRTKRPFLGRGVTLNEGGMRRQVREATKAIVEMKKTGQLESGAKGRVIPFSQYVEETGGDLARERARLLTAAEKNKSAVEIKFLKDKTISDKEALSIYETVKVERNPQAEDPLAVSDADLKKMRTLLDSTPNPNVGSPAARKKALEAIEKARETSVTFYTKKGVPLTLSAESMWKTMGDKKNPEAGIDAGPRRAKRLFADAVTSILQRPDIDGKRIPDISNVMIDTATGRRASSPDSRPGKGSEDITSRIENDARDIEEAVEDNNFDAVEDIVTRLEADAREGERMLADLKDADGRKRSVDDFRQRYAAARKAGQSAEALEKIRRIGEFSNDPDAQKQMKDNVAALRAAARGFMSMSREAELAQKAETQGEGGVENMTQETNQEKKGPRVYEEDTGLKVGAEKRGSTPVVAKREVGDKFNSQLGATPGKVLSAEEQAAIVSDIETMLGKDIKVEFGTFAQIGGSGSYSTKTGQRVIKLAMDSLNPGSVALHESLHDFFAQLGADKNTEKMKRELLQAAESAPVYAQLKALLQGHPEALKQIDSDPEERLAYMFQFYFMARPDGSRMLNLGSGTIKIFERLAQMIRKLLGVASQEQRVEEYLNALRSGKFADISAAGQIAAQIQSTELLAEKIKEKMGIVSDISDRMFTATTDRLRETDVPALVKIADLFHVEPGREQGKLRFLQRRAQMAGKYGNRLQDILANSTADERTAALENLQSMKPAQTPMEKEIRALLEDLYQYMDKSGVKRKVKGKYQPLPHLKDYFPRNWDPSRINGQSAQFIADLMQYGKYSAEDAGNLTGYMTKMDEGSVDLAESEHHLGYTPYTKATIERTANFQFIDASNADKFAKYQSKDLVEIMSTYINQAVHRAEYAKDFGNDGEVLTDLIEEAQKQGATPADIKMAGTATRALEGTLGSSYSPKMRALMNGVITMENLILLPLSLFSQVVDVAGIGARSGNFKESLTALNDGAKALARSFTKIPPGEAEEMARTLGIIDEQNMLEAMGQVHSSMYMSNKLKKINRAFFRLNRMEAWNRQMRVSAMTAGQRFLLANKDNARYMAELDLRPSDVVATPDGLIAMTQADGLTAGQEKRVHDAIFRFVDSAVLRPNAAHRPIWGNDPRFMLLFHLKQFTYSFQNTFIRNMNKELQFGNPKAALIMLTTIPFMIASDIARAALTGTTNPDQTVMGYLARGVARSGLLGTKAFGTDAYSDVTAGQLPGKSFLGPAAEHGILLLKGLLGVPGTTGSDILLRSIPGGTALRGVVNNQ